jgi:IMP dehydrogenase
MTAEHIVSAPPDITLDEAKRLLHQHRIEKLTLVDANGVLKGLLTVKDIEKARDFPHAAKDAQGRLIVGAAVGVGADLEQRLELMMAAGLDAVVIDTAHGHSAGVIEAIRRIRAGWPDLPIVAGNVVTEEGAADLIAAGANAIKVGVGAGSICTTRIIAGAGMPQLSAIYNCAQAAKRFDVPLIADGGIKYSGDIVKRWRRARIP